MSALNNTIKLINVPEQKISIKNSQFINISTEGEPYVGTYEVIPTLSEQRLNTKDKVMTDDVVIKDAMEIYQEGYEEGRREGINPEWTDWGFFCYMGKRSDLLAKLRYTDTSNGTDFTNFAVQPSNSELIMPNIDTANGENFENMFHQWGRYNGTIPEYNLRNGKNFTSMFGYMQSFRGEFPALDTRNGTNFTGMFQRNRTQKITEINISSATDCTAMFFLCYGLTYIRFAGTIPVSVSFSDSPLDVDSMKNIISCLVNYAGTEKAYTQKITFSTKCWEALEASGSAPDGGSWENYVYNLGWNT